MFMPLTFVTKVYLLIFKLNDYKLDPDTAGLCKSLETFIEEKLEAMRKRELFTKYKTAPPGSLERNALRQQYLEFAFIHKDWISYSEEPF
jgi:hypothetical protein